ncbi:Mini-ribonuclease 3 [Desulforamulus hydrothermalis]|uniref:Mini-ribonuclease 3 n=1 Tax=Desulforamulus hydrothermalis Lam5 = DSM 18033 TaxID=1121428 RepID=K8DYF1_9FIRM|nr:Mini-ribonuclease 3 [Desulforamulus hydrothermalis]CCO07775.1 putative ribonuclease mrnC [Desulforamulus hydrothermalis Lam5 = DSM 18033]SHH39632.1 ribonuclease-3 family protein [Desulforamulus hydrothermalis Lam5 = DSM 18033]
MTLTQRDTYIMDQSASKQNPEQLPSLVLAYLGDAVYELAVRRFLIAQGATKVNRLHREAVKYVRAGAQARALFALEDKLSEQELAVVRRGRNAKSGLPPKGADVAEYRHATALEALIGYLYLQGNEGRIDEIIGLAIDALKRG